MHLTPEQIQLFRHNGFLKLPEGLSEETVAQLKETIWKDIRDEVAPIVRDHQGRVVRISQIWDRHPIFCEAMTCPQILDPLESLLGPNIELVRNRHNHATLRLTEDGGPNFMHRDVMQWSRSIVTILFYLEDSTIENGCTLLIPGSHLLPPRPTISLMKDEELQRSGIFDQWVPVPMPMGGLLAIDSMIMHAAGYNQTSGSRISMTVGYHGVDELSSVENPQRVLVRGQRIYMGNDKY